MHVYALTGSIAAGKSTVGALFREWGATVFDADALVHELQRPGQPVLAAMVAEFGNDILDAHGALDRPKMRQQMLADPRTKKQLEAIVHPAVESRRRELVEAAKARGERFIIADIPLLFEAADPAAYDGVIVVDAPVAERRRRLMHDRKLSESDADKLIAGQLPAAEKRARATWIIDNDGDRAALAQRARAVFDALLH